jgi:hypothetical protein
VDLKTEHAVRVAAERAGVALETARDAADATTLETTTNARGATTTRAKRAKKMIEEL